MGEANGSPLVWLRMLRTVIGCFGLFSSMWSLPRSPMSHLTVELRQILLDRVVQLHLALVDQHHQRGGRDGLGLRGDPEEAVGLHRLLRGDVGVADRLGVEHLVLVGDQHDRAGQLVLVHEGLHARPPGDRRGRRAFPVPEKQRGRRFRRQAPPARRADGGRLSYSWGGSSVQGGKKQAGKTTSRLSHPRPDFATSPRIGGIKCQRPSRPVISPGSARASPAENAGRRRDTRPSSKRRSRAESLSSNSRARASSTSLRQSANCLPPGWTASQRMRWTPKGVRTGGLTAPTSRAKAAREKPSPIAPWRAISPTPAALLGAGRGRVLFRRRGEGNLPGQNLAADVLGPLHQGVEGLLVRAGRRPQQDLAHRNPAAVQLAAMVPEIGRARAGVT